MRSLHEGRGTQGPSVPGRWDADPGPLPGDSALGSSAACVLLAPGGIPHPWGDDPAVSTAVPRTDSPRPAPLSEEARVHSASLGCWDPRRPPVSFSFPLQALSSLASSGRVSSAGPKPVLPETRPAALGHPALGGMLWGRLAQMPLRQELTQAWRRRGSLLPGACHFSRQWPVAVPSSLSPVLDQLLWALPLLPRGLVRGPKLPGQTYRRLGWGLTLIVTKIMFLPATSPGSPDRRLQVPQFASCPAPPHNVHSLLLGL